MATNSITRVPRCLVYLNGEPLQVESLHVDTNTRLAADTFRLRTVIAADRKQLTSRLNYWGSVSDALVEIYAGFPANPNAYGRNDLSRLVVGRVDDLYLNPAGNSVELYGRDLSAQMMDTLTVEKFPNKTSSDIAAIIAARHGFETAIQPTTGNAGRLFNNDWTLLQGGSEFDLLAYLADREGYRVYMEGTTLHFEPATEAAATPYTVNLWYDADGMLHSDAKTLQVTRNLTLAGTVNAVVRSMQTGQSRPFEAKASRPMPQLSDDDKPQTYTMSVPGLTRDAAQQRANKLLADTLSKERVLRVELPADSTLGRYSMVRLQGSGTSLDADYMPVSVERRFSLKGGYSMTAHCKAYVTDAAVNL